MTNFAAECGADYALIIPPYYQLTTEEGIYGYFKEISDHINIESLFTIHLATRQLSSHRSLFAG